jgi:hypothetical protein
VLEYQNLRIEMMENMQIIHQKKTKKYTLVVRGKFVPLYIAIYKTNWTKSVIANREIKLIREPKSL